MVTVEVLNCTPKPLQMCRISHTVLPAFHKKVSVDYVDDPVKCGIINCSLADIQLLIKSVVSSTCCVSSYILELHHIINILLPVLYIAQGSFTESITVHYQINPTVAYIYIASD